MKSLHRVQVYISKYRFFSHLCSRPDSYDKFLFKNNEIFKTKFKTSSRDLSCIQFLPSDKLNILKRFGKNPERIWRKNSSTVTSNEVVQSKRVSRVQKKLSNFIIPELSPCRIEELSTITGVAFGVCHISWVCVHLPTFTLLDWNAKLLPSDFRLQNNEPNILKLAYEVKHSLPKADLFVMETFSIKGRELPIKANEIHLSSMLTVLLNDLDIVPDWKHKVVFQKQFVLNNLYNLMVNGERVSARAVAENIINKNFSELNEDFHLKDLTESSDLYTLILFDQKFLNFYNASYLEKKEDLSLALLLTLSFIDVNILKSNISLMKIQTKNSFKLTKFE